MQYEHIATHWGVEVSDFDSINSRPLFVRDGKLTTWAVTWIDRHLEHLFSLPGGFQGQYLFSDGIARVNVFVDLEYDAAMQMLQSFTEFEGMIASISSSPYLNVTDEEVAQRRMDLEPGLHVSSSWQAFKEEETLWDEVSPRRPMRALSPTEGDVADSTLWRLAARAQPRSWSQDCLLDQPTTAVVAQYPEWT
ncbi:hypothetical protein ACN47E_003439 [Coniothyrium glycines]